MKIQRLKKENYDELLSLLNRVFSKKNKCEMDFTKELPKMWVRDDEHMGRHLGIFQDGKLVSALGIYPLDATVCGEHLMFYTVGNVATDSEYTGRGYMSALMDAAMSELKALGADGSRLGGKRERYNRYGYESAGENIYYVIGNGGHEKTDIKFKRLLKEDTNALSFAKILYDGGKISVKRSSDNDYADVYNSITAWRNTGYTIYGDGEMIGYFSVSEDGKNIAELYLQDDERLADVLFAWQRTVNDDIVCRVAPHELCRIEILNGICKSKWSEASCHFKIIDWVKVINAFMKLKNEISPMDNGEAIFEIEGYGSIKVYSKNGMFGCEKCNRKADIKYDVLTATRIIFGNERIDDANMQKFFPLPLTWNLQDRV